MTLFCTSQTESPRSCATRERVGWRRRGGRVVVVGGRQASLSLISQRDCIFMNFLGLFSLAAGSIRPAGLGGYLFLLRADAPIQSTLLQ